MSVEIQKLTENGARVFKGYSDRRVAMGVDDFEQHLGDSGELEILRDVVLVVPKRFAKGEFNGGVYAKGTRQETCNLWRGFAETRLSHTFGPENLEIAIPGNRIPTAWFGGYLFNHFGHFTLEGLARTVSAQIAKSAAPVVIFDMARIGALKPYMAQAFQKFGIDSSRIVLVNENTAIDELLVLPPAIEIRGMVRPDRYVSARTSKGGSARSGIVYLSRSKLVARRSIQGETEFEDRLAKAFEVSVLHPQELSFTEQLRAFSSASCIIACEGSALHNVIFDGRLPQMVSLSHSFPSMNYFLCDELVAGHSHYIHAAKHTEAANRNSWEIDSLKVLDYLADTLRDLG